MYRNYGLTGKTVKVEKTHTYGVDEEPWAYAPQSMKILGETSYFLVAEILPHMNPQGLHPSRPYNTCLLKSDILCGDILLNGGAIR